MRNRLKMRHHQGGGHSLTAHIRTEKAHNVIIEREKVIQIAAHDPGRRCYAAHLCAEQNGCKPREPLVRIAEELEMDRTSLYRALSPMVRDGWVASPSAMGSRFRTARLTKAGRRILNNANRKWANVQGTLISRFGQASYDSLLTELYRLADCAEDVDEPTIKIKPPT
jgi:DNA-binding MarR family transcriptional regulator